MVRKGGIVAIVAFLAFGWGLAPCAAGEDFEANQIRFVPSADQGVDVELSRFGSFVALADWSEGNSVRVLDESWELLWKHKQPVYWGGTFRNASILQFAPDESFLIFPAFRTDNDIALVNPKNGAPLVVLTDHDATVVSLALSLDGEHLVSATHDELFLWRRDGRSFTPVFRYTGYGPAISSISFSPDGRQVAVAQSEQMERSVVVYSVEGNRLEESYSYTNGERNLSREYEQIAFSPDGKWLAAGYADTLRIWRQDSTGAGKPGKGWDGRSKGAGFLPAQIVGNIELGPVHSVRFSPDGRFLLTGHTRDVRVWRIADGTWRPVATFTPHHGNIRDMAFSADGTKLAITGRSESNGLGLWSTKGVGSSPLGLLLSAINGRVSGAQRSFLDDALAGQILASVDPALTAPRDMFETESEYTARRGRLRTSIVSLLGRATERHYRGRRLPQSGAEYAVAVPLETQGAYDIDSKTYSVRFMDTDASVRLERDAARALYRNWHEARIIATRVDSPAGIGYSDFRISIPSATDTYPVALSENPFTGEKLDRYGVHVPSVGAGPSLLLRDLEIGGVFPAHYRYYADHALGTVTLQNIGPTVLTEPSLTLFVPGLMQAPSPAELPPALGVGQSVSINIRALFDSSLLDRGESTTGEAQITVTYTAAGKVYQSMTSRPVGILNRNAIRWTDDRKIGSFMTTTDPALLRFSGQVIGMVDDIPTSLLPQSFLSAARLFSAMRAAGVRYVVDPSSAYESLSRDNSSIDFVRFPVETLDSRSGDCDDLSVLYNSLLESVGVSTAYITTPGHIFTAFDSGVPAELAARLFTSPEDFISRDGTAWIPVETTVVDQGFTKAWRTAAVEWREANARGLAQLFTTKEAWRLYPPAGYSPAISTPIPERERVRSLYESDLADYRRSALVPREKAIIASLSLSPSPARENQLGILYAQFGLFEKALTTFEKVLSSTEYLPALINAANVCSLQKQYGKAQEYLQKAGRIDPDNAHVLVRLAFSYVQAGKESDARRTFERMSKIDPALAMRYPLFGGTTAGTTASSPRTTESRAARDLTAGRLFGSDWYDQ